MNLKAIRQLFQPFSGVEHRRLTSRFLRAFLAVSLLIVGGELIFHLLLGDRLSDSTSLALLGLLCLQAVLWFAVRHGYAELSARTLVILAWVLVTYRAWSAGGVRDAALYIYLLIVFVAALLTGWQISLALFFLSIAAVWSFAVMEIMGLRTALTGEPLRTAGDLTAVFTLLFVVVWLVLTMVRDSLRAVRTGEARFQRVFDASPVAITITSLEEGRLIDANAAFWQMTGLERRSGLGRTAVELGLWSSDLERSSFVSRLKEHKSLQDPEHRIRRSPGEYRVALALYELMDYESTPAIMAIFHDITDEQRTQIALQASEQRYRNFVEQSMQGVWFLAFDEPIPTDLPVEQQVELMYNRGYLAECNDALARMYGFRSGEAMRGTRLLDLLPGREVGEINFLATRTLILEGYRSINRETREQTREGRIVHFLNNAVGLLEGRSLVGLWGTQLDITALKETEEALRRSEARTRALLDAIPDMIFEFSRDGTIRQFVSSSVNRPLLPPEEFMGKKIGEVLPVAADQTLFAIERALESGQVHAFEYQMQHADGPRTFEARLAPLSADTVLAIVRDMSLQKWIQGERENLINELESKNAELERFTYTVSHDLKSPLITIKGFLGFLRQDAASGNLERLRGDVQRIDDAADRMQMLLNDLLELSRIGRLVNEPESIDLNRLVAEVLELLHGRLHAGNIRVRVAESLPGVQGDRPRLLEVLQNLIDNAARFMGAQPDPCIEIGQEGLTETGAPILFVRDNGIGIDPRFQERIFGLFEKLDPRSDGTGIGLALAKRIVEFHGGRIWVVSRPGQGATFYFTLPPRGAAPPKAG